MCLGKGKLRDLKKLNAGLNPFVSAALRLAKHLSDQLMIILDTDLGSSPLQVRVLTVIFAEGIMNKKHILTQIVDSGTNTYMG